MANIIRDAPSLPNEARSHPIQRGYPEGFEILTEYGFIPLNTLMGGIIVIDETPTSWGEQPHFLGGGELLDKVLVDQGDEVVADWTLIDYRTLPTLTPTGRRYVPEPSKIKAYTHILGDEIPFTLTKLDERTKSSIVKYRDYYYSQKECTDSFPKIATVNVNPASVFYGMVEFVRPHAMQEYLWENDTMIRFKGRGLNLYCTSDTDLWSKNKHGRGWRFNNAGNIARAGHIDKSAFKILNEYNETINGYWYPLPSQVSPDWTHIAETLPLDWDRMTDTDYKLISSNSGNKSQRLQDKLIEKFGSLGREATHIIEQRHAGLSANEQPILPQRVPQQRPRWYLWHVDKSYPYTIFYHTPEQTEAGISKVLSVPSDLLLYSYIDHPFTCVPKKHVRRLHPKDYPLVAKRNKIMGYETDSVMMYNFSASPYHNFIVREQGITNREGVPLRWQGNPVVVGDGIDKIGLNIRSIVR